MLTRFKMSVIGITASIAIMASFGYTIIQEGFVGVKYTLGKVSPDALPAGLHFQIPLLDKIIPLRIARLSVSYAGDKPDDENAIYEAPLNTINKTPTGTTIVLTVSPTLIVTINPHKAVELLQNYGKDFAKTLIHQCTINSVQTIFAEVDLSNQSTTVETLKTALSKELIGCFKQTGDLINLQAVNLSFSLPSEIMTLARKVYEARLNQEKLTAELANAEVSNKTALLIAENEAKVAALKAMSHNQGLITYYLELGVSPERAIILSNMTIAVKAWDGALPLGISDNLMTVVQGALNVSEQPKPAEPPKTTVK